MFRQVSILRDLATCISIIPQNGDQPKHVESEINKCLRPRLKCDGTRTETRFRLSAKRTSPFKSAGASVQSTTGSRGGRISGSIAGYTMFRGGVKGTGYPLHSPASPSLPLPCVTVCHRISTGLYKQCTSFVFRLLFFFNEVPIFRISTERLVRPSVF